MQGAGAVPALIFKGSRFPLLISRGSDCDSIMVFVFFCFLKKKGANLLVFQINCGNEICGVCYKKVEL